MQLSHSGKVKDIYEVDSNSLLFHFTDRVSAFDVPMVTPVLGKGKILCKFAEFWFRVLNVKNHMIRLEASDKMLVRKLTMIPIECIVRGYIYGSFYERLKLGNSVMEIAPEDCTIASKLQQPIFDPTTKNKVHDRPISDTEILDAQILSSEELDQIKATSLTIYDQMSKLAEKADFIIADAKFEFGREITTGEIILADSIGPDEFRIWSKSLYEPGKLQESYDKQYLRDWLTKIGFKKKLDEGRQDVMPLPPILPQAIIDELLNRYNYVYQKISSQT
ncbi:MAG TPA: phosphoribosylaminoimidazolesuccinocarboxamide synthase [Nitrososphaeraceae archaeon]|jgi:phosphoribosylaminoimidazole-succinocarboxamide synthase